MSLINTIEFHLTERPDLDAPGRRHIARAWGVVYMNDDGSEEEETTPENPVPAPVPRAPQPFPGTSAFPARPFLHVRLKSHP